MKRVMLRSLTAFGIFVAVSATNGAAQTVVGFDDLVGNSTAVPAGYGGINWGPGWQSYAWEQDPYNANSGAVRIYNYTNPAYFSFTAATQFNGAYFAGPTSISAFFTLFLNNTQVHTSQTLGLTSTPTFLHSGYTGLVDRVQVNSTPGYFVMDDVSYGSATVTPEPISMTLLGTGLAGIAAARRRRRQNASSIA